MIIQITVIILVSIIVIINVYTITSLLWNKMLTNEAVIMTVNLWGGDRLHLHFEYHSVSIFFQLFGQNVFCHFFFIHETFFGQHILVLYVQMFI